MAASASLVPLNDLGRAVQLDRDRIDSAVRRVLGSGWFVLGPEVEAFEGELSAYLGTAHAVGVGNGTDALMLALLAVGCEPGDKFVTVANAGGYATFAGTAVGLQPRYADVDPRTLLMTAETLEPALSESVRAVVVTHLYGCMADVSAITDLCRPRGIAVIEDCAQAIGARSGQGAAGTLGDAASFSFYPTKNLGALGDGGAVVTSDERIADRLLSLRQYGWSRKYLVELRGGRNSRLDELQAAILRERLPLVDEANERRRQIHSQYRDALSSERVRFVHAASPGFVAHLAVLWAQDRDAVQAALLGRGIRSEVHYPVPDHRQPVSDAAGTVLPTSESAAEHVLSVPCFPELDDDEIGRVCDALADL